MCTTEELTKIEHPTECPTPTGTPTMTPTPLIPMPPPKCFVNAVKPCKKRKKKQGCKRNNCCWFQKAKKSI